MLVFTRTTIVTLAAWLSLFVGVQGPSAQGASDPEGIDLLRQDFEAGLITVDDFARYGIYALLEPRLLPVRYLSDHYPDDDLAIVEFFQHWEELAPATQAEIEQFFTNLRDGYYYTLEVDLGVSLSEWPECVEDLGFLELPSLACHHSTEHFRITYTLPGFLGGVPAEDGDGNQVPDYVDNVAASLESAWTTYFDLGYPAPTVTIEVSITGAVPDGRGVAPPTNDIVLSNVGAEHYLPRHELFHIFQWEYGSPSADPVWERLPARVEWARRRGTLWWMEATAEWAAHQASLFPGAEEALFYARRLPDFLGRPHLALDSYETPKVVGPKREYGAFILAEYLEERFGTPGVIRETWDRTGAPNGPGGLQGVADEVQERGDFAQELAEFARRNYLLAYGDADLEAWKDELRDDALTAANDLGDARPARLRHDLDHGIPETGSATIEPGGALYVDLAPTITAVEGTLSVEVTRDAAGELDLALLVFSEYPSLCEEAGFTFAGDQGIATVDVGGQCRYATLVATHTNPVSGTTSPLDWTATHQAQLTTRVSVSSSGGQANNFSFNPVLSPDGRYVAFGSHASNLVPDDTNGVPDVFVHDRATGETSRVSVSSAGEQADHWSTSPSISSDGRYLAFESLASNLVPGDIGRDVFVHDRATGETTRVSVSSAGEQGNDESHSPSISADGRYVVFWSWASNLVEGDTNGFGDVFLHDRSTGETTRVSVSSAGAEGNQESRNWRPSISDDGRYVLFESDASNLVGGDTNDRTDVFLHDHSTAETTRVSVSSSGEEADNFSGAASISADGLHVVFGSAATNLVDGDTNGTRDVFLHGVATGTTSRVSVGTRGEEGNDISFQAAISADGNFVAFASLATNLVSGDGNGAIDVFLRDLASSVTSRVSLSSLGDAGDADSLSPFLSGDGKYIAFQSDAANLVSGDTNAARDVFVRYQP
ncbi:MAG: hypothetical protein ACRDXD_08925 [Acidimicrobiia bacterium]